MPPTPQHAPAAGRQRETPRVALARAAMTAALSHPAVARLDAGAAGRNVTFAGTERLAGVTAVADGERHAVALFVVATPVDLGALATELSAAVRAAAAAAGHADALGSVHVTFTDLDLSPEATHP